MNQDTHNRYFQHIAYNQDPSIAWPVLPTAHPVHQSARSAAYEDRVHQLLTNCKHLSQLDELQLSSSSPSSPLSLVCLWIDVEPAPDYGHPPFELISSSFGIWHEHRRGCHKGLHEFYWSPSPSGSETKPSHYILLLNVREVDGRADSSYRQYKPSHVQPIPPTAFKSIGRGK
jgi:hypothetical protein